MNDQENANRTKTLVSNWPKWKKETRLLKYNQSDSLLLEKAYQIAAKAHTGQVRKYTGESYINHPINVANKAKEYGASIDEIIACILHDVIEDTELTLEYLSEFFNANVIHIVNVLSKPELDDIITTKEDRNKVYEKRLANACASIQQCKTFDIMDNSKDVVDNDVKFAKSYLKRQWRIVNSFDKLTSQIERDVKLLLIEQAKRIGIDLC